MNNGQLHGVRLLVYDLDGTLLDAFDDIRTCLNRALAEAGQPALSMDTVRGAVGDGAAMLVRRCLGEARMALFDRVYASFLDFYANNSAPVVHLYPGVLEALAAIRKIGLSQAILTNKPQAVTEQSCERLGLTGAVDAVWGQRAGGPLKPDPESLLRVVRHFGVEPGECAMVGDYRADFDVAKAAGTRMIGVTWGLFSREQVEAEHPDAQIDGMEKLAALFEPKS